MNKSVLNAIAFTLFLLICGVLGVVAGELVITYLPFEAQAVIAIAAFGLITWIAYG